MRALRTPFAGAEGFSVACGEVYAAGRVRGGFGCAVAVSWLMLNGFVLECDCG